MKKEIIAALVRTGILRPRQLDLERIKSIVKSVEINASVAKTILLNEDSATLIFREIYESIRQLGDAEWWLLGYEPTNHEISLEILKEAKVKERIMLNWLERFKKIRNDANYRGFRVSVSQAKEIITFWDSCCKDILKELSRKLKAFT